MNKIITVTLNPAIDRITKVPDFHIGAVQSSIGTQVYAAGKGVNVARALSCMGHDVTAIGVIGKDNVWFFDHIKVLELKGKPGVITTDWILTETPTRTNCTLIDPVRSTETHVREVINTLEKFPMDKVEQALRNHCTEGDVVIFSGSLPKNAPADTYYRLCSLCKGSGAKVIIDSSGDALKESLKASPDMIKPNVEELQDIVGQKFFTKAEIISAARTLSQTFSISTVLVSMGEEGAVLYDSRNEPRAIQAEFISRLDQKQVCTVGSGDAMVAAASVRLLEGAGTEDLLVDGMAAGVANLIAEGPGMLSRETMLGFRNAIGIGECI